MSSIPPTPPTRPRDDRYPRFWDGTPPWFIATAGILIAAIVVFVAILVFRDDGDDQVVTAEPTPTPESTPEPTTAIEPEPTETEAPTATETPEPTATAQPTPTSEPQATPTSTPAPTTPPIDPEVFATAVWPWFDSSVRYDDPVAAATGFAETFIGFEDPIIGSFQAGDNRSGEVEVRPSSDGPITVIIVRQLGADDTWWVLGATTANIVVEMPQALDNIDTPMSVSGQAWAFEGTFNIELRVDGSPRSLVDSFVTGGGTELAPFQAEFPFVDPSEGAGALVFVTRSAQNGQVWEAAVVRVSYS